MSREYRKWTEEELKLIKNMSFTEESIKKISEITGRKERSVDAMFRKLGFSKCRKHEKYILWTENEIKLFNEFKTISEKDIKTIAKLTGRTESAIKIKIYKLGLQQKINDRKNTKWLKKDIEYLEENWGTKSIPQIAKYLRRTINAVKEKAGKLKLGDIRFVGENLTFNQLSEATGNHYNIIYHTWMEDNNMPVIKKRPSGKKQYKYVNINEFWKWAYEHRNIINFARFTKGALGKEPDWVDEKRKSDALNPTKQNAERKWTKAEDAMLEGMLKAYKYGYKELSEALNRTESAVKRRIYDLALPYRPVPRNNSIKWKEHELKKAFEMYKKGHTVHVIARTLNKSELGLGERLLRMAKEENI